MAELVLHLCIGVPLSLVALACFMGGVQLVWPERRHPVSAKHGARNRRTAQRRFLATLRPTHVFGAVLLFAGGLYCVLIVGALCIALIVDFPRASAATALVAVAIASLARRRHAREEGV